jgi:hypothetical protein
MPTFLASMPAVFLLGFGIVVIIDGAHVMGVVMIALSVVLFVIWSRMWAKKSA